MKKYFALPLAVVFVAACSDTATAPAKSSDLAVSYGKPIAPPTDACASGCSTIGSFDFEGIGISAGATLGTEIQPGAAGVADAPIVITAPSGENFVGRFANTRTNVVINVDPGYNKYSLAFDFYTIGSWDGRGKQAQHGVFEANVFDISYQCGTATAVSIFKTSFSTQLTVQQDYPQAYLTGGNKAATGSFATDALNYRSDPVGSNTPQFRSFGDVSYHMLFSGENPCGPGAAVQFEISTSNPTQQSVRDESWGVDNILVKAGT